MIIYASNIHQGGGKVLLLSLLSKIQAPSILFGDARLVLDEPIRPNITRISVQPSVVARLLAEIKLWRLVKPGEKVLCFGNLPPLMPLAGKTSLYFQNTILFEANSNLPFSWKTKIKHSIERLWLKWGMGHVDMVYVQSEVVRSGFLKEFHRVKVVIAPFMDALPTLETSYSKEYDFVFVASGDPHKNHYRLLRAWELLADMGMFPNLALTLSDQDRDLLSYVSSLIQKGIKIQNFPKLSHAQVLELYGKSKALIYPSLTESFGLPLLEAKTAGIPILASELDYVREVVSPVQTFDPQSERSICRAVQRFLNSPSEKMELKVLSPGEFLDLLEG